MYILCADSADSEGSGGTFQAPEDEENGIDSARRRIALGCRLLQTFTAEKLHEHALGRKSFVLESDLRPDVAACHVFTSKLTTQQAHAMTGGELWMYFARELMSSRLFKDKDCCKWFAFMSFTRYCPPEGVIPKSHSDVLKSTKGHTALGK
jgi:hypothetical protein